MPRKFKSFEHFNKADAKYNNLLAAKFINCLMWDGKKSTAQGVFYRAMDLLKERFPKDDPIEVFIRAVENVKPKVEVRSRRVGGATYQVPMDVSYKRQQSLAIRWIIGAVRKKKGRPAHLSLADELTAAFNREGEAMRQRDTTHKMADANKAFAHFAW